MISLFETITDVTGYKILRKSFGLRNVRRRGRAVCVYNEELDGLGRLPSVVKKVKLRKCVVFGIGWDAAKKRGKGCIAQTT
jgi:hypothetical protein